MVPGTTILSLLVTEGKYRVSQQMIGIHLICFQSLCSYFKIPHQYWKCKALEDKSTLQEFCEEVGCTFLTPTTKAPSPEWILQYNQDSNQFERVQVKELVGTYKSLSKNHNRIVTFLRKPVSTKYNS